MRYTNKNPHEVFFSNAHGATIRLAPGASAIMGKTFIESALKANVHVEPDDVAPTKSEDEIRAEVEAKVRAELEAKIRSELSPDAKVSPELASTTEPTPPATAEAAPPLMVNGIEVRPLKAAAEGKRR